MIEEEFDVLREGNKHAVERKPSKYSKANICALFAGRATLRQGGGGVETCCVVSWWLGGGGGACRRDVAYAPPSPRGQTPSYEGERVPWRLGGTSGGHILKKSPAPL